MALPSPDNVGPPEGAAPHGIPLEQYRVAFDRNPQPMWVFDLDTLRFIAVNDAAVEHYGYSRGEFLAMTIEDIRPPEDVSALRKQLDHRVEGLEQSGVWRHRRRDGTIIEAEIVSHELVFGSLQARVVLATDVTARRRAENAQRAQLVVALRLAESATLEEAAPKLLDGLGSTMGWDAATIWQLDESADVLRFEALWCAPATSTSIRLELESALRDTVLAPGEGWAGRAWEGGEPVRQGNGRELDRSPCAAALAQASLHCAVAVPIVSGADVLGVLEFFGGPNRQIGDEVLRTLTIVSAQLGQFLERERAEGKLAYQAIHDPLTGLPNRVLFLDRLTVALARSRRRRPSVAVLFIDIDNFKVVNDSLGHLAGDELLCAVATRISLALRPGDTVARFGGDEFVVMADQIGGIEDAAAIAERITCVLGDPFALVPGEHFVSASIGIAISRNSAQEAEDLIRDSDTAMYRAKQRGRGQYEVFDEVMRAHLLDRLRTEKDLRIALQRAELRLFYQPVVELPTGTVVGVEALVRWEHPERGLLAPSEFIPLAEECGLILPLGRWVLTEACRQAAAWQRSRPGRPPLPVSVNVSAMQTSHGSLGRVVADAVREAGLDPALLKLELTESVLMEETDGLVATLRNLQSQGVQLVLDDFGTGYSALGYLHRFPIDGLKIDRSFVAGIGTDVTRTGIVRAVIDMARALEIEVVAEGVETASQAGLVFGLGCRYAQGFYFARPAPAEESDAVLAWDKLPSGRPAE